MNEITHIPSEITRRKDNFPYPAPFILSSMERWLCGKDDPNHKPTPENVVYIKRRHLEENLKTIAVELKMDEQEQKRFLDYWCCARGDEIRAEGDPYFDLRQRAESWMERARPATPQQPQQKSRVQKYAETSKQASDLINGFFGFSSDQNAENGSAVPPDEQ